MWLKQVREVLEVEVIQAGQTATQQAGEVQGVILVLEVGVGDYREMLRELALAAAEVVVVVAYGRQGVVVVLGYSDKVLVGAP